TAAPSSRIQVNSNRPRPFPQRATCSAAHSKKPDSSSSRLITITAINVAVAFQTIFHTTGISLMWITPLISASAAPMVALQPMLSPLGCQMTSTSVNKKIAPARNIFYSIISVIVNMFWSARARKSVFQLHTRLFPQAVPAGVDNGCRPCRHVGRETVVDPLTLATVDGQPGLAQ